MDPIVAWILSMDIVPRSLTIRRRHRFVSYSTTLFVCIPRILAVAVSQKNLEPPCCIWAIEKQYYCIGI